MVTGGMLVLYETPAGYALFRMADDGKLSNPDDIHKHFETPVKANETVKLKAFQKFDNTTDALSAVTALVEGKMSKNLKKFLSDELSDIDLKGTLAVGDPKLGGAIAKKLGIKVVSDSTVNELFRGIRSQLNALVSGIAEADMNAMVLGLSHSLSRYKLKFSPDKVDTMIIQAIHLLDDLDKELNTYSMRVKEWYGWHFPEMTKVVVDNLAYAKVVKTMGYRSNASTVDLSSILPEEIETEVKDAAEISMGTEINEEDIENITYLCDQIISISEYRAQLYDYLKNRMAAIAPNLTCLVGELVGARLIAHAGSLLNLAKYPASTVQILGAEKALFRALKSKHDTPKYGLIYHASLVGQASSKMKGKIARSVATKAALSIRVDALGETEPGQEPSVELGLEQRAKVEARLKQLEGRGKAKELGGPSPSQSRGPKSSKMNTSAVKNYNNASDILLAGPEPTSSTKTKRKHSETNGDSVAAAPITEGEAPAAEDTAAEGKKKKKSKKEKKAAVVEEVEAPEPVVEQVAESDAAESGKKKKKRKATEEAEVVVEAPPAAVAHDGGEEPKKKKKKKQKTSADE
ncbi:hypothetical protein SmJEL517_g05004 [Synchytrium microbalum]|uniref:Nucleolar protein 58 n=1 Tax=Synchytrium microbalum TaxID=1806994 RepID=A0A507C2J6_9FUNG|nr:uncharacterized protein SmJEL517_g05004 [Synchytrium microbalum]TPX31733.1 hypothetical protein SmJEL517_g05004 [Synchytrium microbalum]